MRFTMSTYTFYTGHNCPIGVVQLVLHFYLNVLLSFLFRFQFSILGLFLSPVFFQVSTYDLTAQLESLFLKHTHTHTNANTHTHTRCLWKNNGDCSVMDWLTFRVRSKVDKQLSNRKNVTFLVNIILTLFSAPQRTGHF